MSGEFDLRKYSHSTKLKQRPQILSTLSFRQFYDSEWPGLHAPDNMANSCVKNRSKAERYAVNHGLRKYSHHSK